MKELTTKNGHALGYIIGSIHENLLHLLEDGTSPIGAWKILKDHCGNASTRASTEVTFAFNTFMMEPNEDVHAFLKRFSCLEIR